jgi:Flp pilus assembly protein TadD
MFARRAFFFQSRLVPHVNISVSIILSFYFFLSIANAFAQQTIQSVPTRVPDGSESRHLDPVLIEAKSLLQEGKAAEAEQSLRNYLLQRPDSADAHFLLGYVLFHEIQESAASIPGFTISSKKEKVEASLAEFTAGAKYRAPSASDLKIVALDYVLIGDYLDADKWLTKMLEWDPNDSEGWYYLGRAKYNENRFEEAVRAFQQSLKLDPKNIKTLDNLGLSYVGLGRVDDAISAYRTALDSQQHSLTKNPGPLIDFGSLLLDQNRTEEAVPYLREAVQIAEQDFKAHELLGKAYSRLEHFPQAQAELEKAIYLAPENPTLPCMLGTVYRKQGLTAKGQAELNRCAIMNGTHSSPEIPRP